MKPLLALALALACQPAAGPLLPAATVRPAPFDHTHADLDAVLRAHVKGDRFDYAALKADPSRLDAYLSELRAVTPAELAAWTREQRFAFWINAYNAWTLKKVVDHYPLKSIRELDKLLGLKTVFEQAWIPMNAFAPDGKGGELALNDIEHGILRAQFQDARLHAAINCASISCPPLRAEAYVAERLDAQLDEQMRAFVNDPKRNEIDREDGVLRLSEIFKWFQEDFEAAAGSVREFLVRYAPPEEQAFLPEAKIKYLDYDWDLNDVR